MINPNSPKVNSARDSEDLIKTLTDPVDRGDDSGATPVIVSFGAGVEYYREASVKMRELLDRMGVENDISFLEMSPDLDWADICRTKLAFMLEMLNKHKRAVIWLDVDTEIVRRPDLLLEVRADIVCFLRNFKYLPHFDAAQHARLIAPSLLGFAYNERTLAFLNHAVSLVEQSSIRATDDYFLQEALLSFEGQLTFGLLPSNMMASTRNRDASPTTYFVHGDSGNVPKFIGSVEQHRAPALDQARQRRVLWDSAEAASRSGKIDHALVFYSRIFELDESDTEALGRLLDILRRQDNVALLGRYFRRYENDPRHATVVERVSFLRRLDKLNYGKARGALKQALQSDSPNVPFMKSRMVRHSLDDRASRMGIPDDQRVPLWWMEPPYPGNFGDIINPYVIEKLTGIPPRFTTKPDKVLAIGSIIKFAKPGTRVWGAGASSLDQEICAEAHYHAVRGPLTRERVLAAGGSCEPVYGDAAWFLPKIFTPKVSKTHKLGVIFHKVHDEYARLVDPDVKIISVERVGYDEIEQFITEMCQCEAIISTSLHGVIVAHAYGIPVRWCVASESSRQIHGDGLKFQDYFASVGREAPTPLDISSLQSISSDLASQCIDNPSHPIDTKALAAAAPFEVLEIYR